MERRLQLVLHSLALRDVVTLWVESVFILDRSEGLAVFAGVSSSVSCRFQFLFNRVGTGHVLLCSMFRQPSVGCIMCRMFFPSLFAPFAFSLRVQLPEWSVQPLVAVPWGEPISVYSHSDVQFPVDSDGCFYDCVDMRGLLEVLFDTLLYALTD